jgi:hypothetical protein
VRIAFSAARLAHVLPYLSACGIPLEPEPEAEPEAESGGGVPAVDPAHLASEASRSFVVDLSLVRRHLKRLSFAEASAFNLEQWYEPLKAHTARTTIVALVERDLGDLQRLIPSPKPTRRPL